jgi:very-short-patch-repair endonuclease
MNIIIAALTVLLCSFNVHAGQVCPQLLNQIKISYNENNPTEEQILLSYKLKAVKDNSQNPKRKDIEDLIIRINAQPSGFLISQALNTVIILIDSGRLDITFVGNRHFREMISKTEYVDYMDATAVVNSIRAFTYINSNYMNSDLEYLLFKLNRRAELLVDEMNNKDITRLLGAIRVLQKKFIVKTPRKYEELADKLVLRSIDKVETMSFSQAVTSLNYLTSINKETTESLLLRKSLIVKIKTFITKTDPLAADNSIFANIFRLNLVFSLLVFDEIDADMINFSLNRLNYNNIMKIKKSSESAFKECYIVLQYLSEIPEFGQKAEELRKSIEDDYFRDENVIVREEMNTSEKHLYAKVKSFLKKYRIVRLIFTRYRNRNTYGFEFDIALKHNGNLIDIEFDSSYHTEKRNLLRDKFLKKKGITVVRITHSTSEKEIQDRLGSVLGINHNVFKSSDHYIAEDLLMKTQELTEDGGHTHSKVEKIYTNADGELVADFSNRHNVHTGYRFLGFAPVKPANGAGYKNKIVFEISNTAYEPADTNGNIHNNQFNFFRYLNRTDEATDAYWPVFYMLFEKQ